MAVHLLWELVLLLAAGAVAFVLYRGHRAEVSGGQLRDLMVSTAILGLLALAAGLSLRAAVPNLAVGPIAYGSGLFFAAHTDRGLVQTAILAVLLAAGVGAVLALLVVGFHVPPWVASFGAALAVMVWIQMHTGTVKLPAGTYQPNRHAMYWLAGFAALAVLGGLSSLSKGVRRGVARFRPVADPARRRGATGGIIATLALLGSSVLAGVGGVLFALHAGTLAPPENSLVLTGLALGAALLGGTSAFGRRGGIFGTVFAVALLSLLIRYADVTHRQVAPLAVAAGAVGIGLIVTRLVETFGRPRSVVEDDDEWAGASTPPGASSADASWSPSRSGWTTQSGTDERWVSEDRWGNR
jgi:ribose/xylose/arabinose/galactoside ABC-type transport system permease subunit